MEQTKCTLYDFPSRAPVGDASHDALVDMLDRLRSGLPPGSHRQATAYQSSSRLRRELRRKRLLHEHVSDHREGFFPTSAVTRHYGDYSMELGHGVSEGSVALRQLVSSLPEESQEALALSAMGHTSHEIGQRLGIGRRAATQRINRARDWLRRELDMPAKRQRQIGSRGRSRAWLGRPFAAGKPAVSVSGSTRTVGWCEPRSGGDAVLYGIRIHLGASGWELSGSGRYVVPRYSYQTPGDLARELLRCGEESLWRAIARLEQTAPDWAHTGVADMKRRAAELKEDGLLIPPKTEAINSTLVSMGVKKRTPGKDRVAQHLVRVVREPEVDV